jgi:hypothetical protein
MGQKNGPFLWRLHDLYACPGTIPAHIHLSSYDKDKEGNEKEWVLLFECNTALQNILNKVYKSYKNVQI